MQIKAQIRRFVLGMLVPIATGAATWVNPPPDTEPQVDTTPGSGVGVPLRHIETAPHHPGVAVALPPNSQSDAVPGSGATVARWGFGHDLGTAQDQVLQANMMRGRPVYLRMTLNGTQAAIDRMRADRPLTIEVRWVRENGESASGAPNLVTGLTIGRPGLAAALEQEVRRRGFFEWHSWARKDTLSPGTWTVSVTYPDGQPLLCGQDAQPCRFTIDVG